MRTYRAVLSRRQTRAKLTAAIFAEVSTYLGKQHLLMREGNQWYFGMKAHIGADAESGLVHSLSTTAANISDIEQTHRLLHGREKDVYLDAGYTGVEEGEEKEAIRVRNERKRK